MSVKSEILSGIQDNTRWTKLLKESACTLWGTENARLQYRTEGSLRLCNIPLRCTSLFFSVVFWVVLYKSNPLSLNNVCEMHLLIFWTLVLKAVLCIMVLVQIKFSIF